MQVLLAQSAAALYEHRPATVACFMAESARQHLPPNLMLAVLQTEGGKMAQFVKNANGTYDMGPFQVNTTWLPELARLTGGRSEDVAKAIAYDGCTNIAVGAWILRRFINEAGGDIWKGVAFYHSHNSSKGLPYAQSVYRRMQNLPDQFSQVFYDAYYPHDAALGVRQAPVSGQVGGTSSQWRAADGTVYQVASAMPSGPVDEIAAMRAGR